MKLIAEIGSNHNGSLERALELIRAASGAGFDAVKFQAFRVRSMFAPEALERHPELLERERFEVPKSWWSELYVAAFEKGLDLGVTPFDPRSFAESKPFADFLKISSYQLLDLSMLAVIGWHAAEHGLPLILSTGMATMPEVERAIVVLRERGVDDLTILHCVSLYPTRTEEANLRAIQTLKEAFPWATVGWSDHTMNYFTAKQAHAMGAETLELHFDLDDRQGAEARHSWMSYEVRQLRRDGVGLLLGEKGLPALPSSGTGIKAPQPRELPERLWRHDPRDGMRPLLELRERWLASERP